MTRMVTKLCIHKTALSVTLVTFIFGLLITAYNFAFQYALGLGFNPMLLFYPFISGISIYLFSALGCFVYNFIAARWNIGITFKTEEKSGA